MTSVSLLQVLIVAAIGIPSMNGIKLEARTGTDIFQTVQYPNIPTKTTDTARISKLSTAYCLVSKFQKHCSFESGQDEMWQFPSGEKIEDPNDWCLPAKRKLRSQHFEVSDADTALSQYAKNLLAAKNALNPSNDRVVFETIYQEWYCETHAHDDAEGSGPSSPELSTFASSTFAFEDPDMDDVDEPEASESAIDRAEITIDDLLGKFVDAESRVSRIWNVSRSLLKSSQLHATSFTDGKLERKTFIVLPNMDKEMNDGLDVNRLGLKWDGYSGVAERHGGTIYLKWSKPSSFSFLGNQETLHITWEKRD